MKKIIFLTALSTAILFSGLISAQETFYKRGCEADSLNQLDSAIKYYTIAIRFNSKDKSSYKNRGIDKCKKEDYDGALVDFIHAVEIDTTDAGLFSNIANVYAIKGEYANSLLAYRQGLKIDSTGKDGANTYFNRAITLCKWGKFESAIGDFNKADKLNPGNKHIYENRGYAYLNIPEKLDSAIADYTRAIAIEPANPDNYKFRGVAEINKTIYKNAIANFNKTISLNPASADSYYYLSFCYKKMGDKKKALDCATKAKNMGYSLPDGYLDELRSK